MLLTICLHIYFLYYHSSFPAVWSGIRQKMKPHQYKAGEERSDPDKQFSGKRKKTCGQFKNKSQFFLVVGGLFGWKENCGRDGVSVPERQVLVCNVCLPRQKNTCLMWSAHQFYKALKKCFEISKMAIYYNSKHFHLDNSIEICITNCYACTQGRSIKAAHWEMPV